MSKTRYSRARTALIKAMRFYKKSKSRRNWKRLRRATARWADL